MAADRWRRLLPALWAGFLLCVALVATPAPFAVLAPADAGRVVGRVLAHEAYASLALGALLLLLERAAARRGGPQFSLGLGLVLGVVFCTVAGHFALLPMMEAARAGRGALTFSQLHAVAMAFFALKLVLVLALAWRASVSPAPSS